MVLSGFDFPAMVKSRGFQAWNRVTMEGRSRELFETLFARMKELPIQVDKAVAAGMDRSIKRLDDEITKVRNYCIAGTIVINVLLVLLALQILM